MGWSLGFDTHWNRDIGYSVPAVCDHPRCNAAIDRGLSYVCGDEPYGGEAGCGLYFCAAHRHRWRAGHNVCTKCVHCAAPYSKPKPDVLQWVLWKLEDASWAAWRAERPEEVAKLKNRVMNSHEKDLAAAREILDAE